VKSQGVELELAFTPNAVEGLSLNFGYAYNDSKFVGGSTDPTEGQLLDILDDGIRNCSALGSSNTEFPAACGTAGPPGFSTLNNWSPVPGPIDGRRTPLSSKHQLSGAIGYTNGLFNTDFDWFARVDASYTGNKYVQVQNLAEIPAATVVNLQLGVESENFRLALWGKNVFDEDSVVSGTRFTQVDHFFRRAFLIFPRRGDQWGATLTARF
jgi:outer membrane receptor protein involved in Fe transport